MEGKDGPARTNFFIEVSDDTRQLGDAQCKLSFVHLSYFTRYHNPSEPAGPMRAKRQSNKIDLRCFQHPIGLVRVGYLAVFTTSTMGTLC